MPPESASSKHRHSQKEHSMILFSCFNLPKNKRHDFPKRGGFPMADFLYLHILSLNIYTKQRDQLQTIIIK